MVEPKHLHPILLLLLLLLPHHGAEAQSPLQPVPPFASHNSRDPSLAIVIAALVGTFLFVALFSIFLRHCVESFLTQQQRNPDWPCSCSQGIHRDLLNTFPILFFSTIKDFHLGKGALECAVCLAEFTDHDTLRLLPQCNHVFHPPCIDAWHSSHFTCPVCRANLNQDSAQVAILVATQLSANVVEGSGSRAEAEGGGENGTEQCPVVHNASEGRKKVDEDKGWPDRASKSKLLRSNSTGNSLVEPGECVERYTLRLPEDVRKYILVNHGVM